MCCECEGDGHDDVDAGEGVVAVKAWCEDMRGRRGSGIVSSAYDVLEMSVVHGVRGVRGWCEMFMCLVLGGVPGEGVTG